MGNNILDAVGPVKHHKPYSATRHLSNAIFQFDAKEKIMVMLMDYKIYFDESENTDADGQPNMPKVYCIAGCVSTSEQWQAFEVEWKEALDKYLLPRWPKSRRPPFFHMKEFANGKSKLYAGMPKEEKDAFLSTLHAIMKKYTLRRFATCVPMADYQALTDEEKFVFGHPHMGAAVNCMKALREWAIKIGLKERMAYIFEKGSGHDRHLSEAFYRQNEEQWQEYRIRSVTHIEKHEMMPLQAADIIAFEWRHEICRRLNPNNRSSAR